MNMTHFRRAGQETRKARISGKGSTSGFVFGTQEEIKAEVPTVCGALIPSGGRIEQYNFLHKAKCHMNSSVTRFFYARNSWNFFKINLLW